MDHCAGEDSRSPEQPELRSGTGEADEGLVFGADGLDERFARLSEEVRKHLELLRGERKAGGR